MNQIGVCLINQNSGKSHPLDPSKDNVIGRDPEAEIPLSDAFISKKHAVVKLDSNSNHWVFTNLSRNGSLLNDRIVSKQMEIKHGDRISVGCFDLSFYDKFCAKGETMELPIIKRRATVAEDWEDDEATPLGTIIETTAMIFFIALSIFIFLSCFVW